MRFLRGAFHPPSFHENTGERKATWMELFFDLAFVVAIAATAHSLSSAESTRGLIEFCVLFVLLQWAWTGYTFYNDRFDSDDLLHRASGLAQMALVLFLSTLSKWLTDDYLQFVVAYSLLRFFTIAFNLFAGFHVPAARRLTHTFAFGFSVALVPLVLGLGVDDPDWRLALVSATALLQLVPPLLPTRHLASLPLSISHIPERLGLFVTLTLGECLTGIARISTTDHKTASLILGSACAITIVFCFWWIYFSQLNGNLLKQLSLRSRFWVYGHVPLTLTLVILAVGLEEQLELIVHPANAARTSLLFLAWGSALICLAAIHGTSKPAGSAMAEIVQVVITVLFGTASLAMLIVPWSPRPIVGLEIVSVMGAILVLLDVWAGGRADLANS